MRTAARSITVIALLAATAGCGNKSMLTRPDVAADPAGHAVTAPPLATARTASALPASQNGGGNGRAGAMPAYYDAKLFTINFTQLSTSESTLLAHNTGVNTIYTDELDMVNSAPFVSVLDAIQGDGFNPLWHEVEVRFKPGHTPRQLFSDDQVSGAFANGEITLHDTGEVYRCSVIGPK